MNAPLDHATLKANFFDKALAEAHAWRGECTQRFAELEEILAQSLLKAAKPRKGRQVSQAFHDFRLLVKSKCRSGKPSAAVAHSLDEIERLLEWRRHLTHGVLAVWQAKNGKWLFTLQHRELDAGPLRTYALPKSDADDILDRLTKEVRDLRSRVGQWFPSEPAA